MSHSDYADNLHSNNGLESDDRQSRLELNRLPNLETLIPKNLSSNKRAVIERLIALHQADSAD